MKKINLLICLLPFVGFGQCPIGQSEVTIDVTTDNYAYEGYWQLVPSGNNCGIGTIFSGGNTAVGCNGGGDQVVGAGGYANNTTISEGPWCLTQGNTYDIVFIDDWGDGGLVFSVNISGFPVYSGLTGGGNPNSVLSFTVNEPLAFDFKGEKINTYSYVNPGNIDVKAAFFNQSTSTINTLTFNYQVDSQPIITQSINAQNITPFTNASFTHNIPWNVSTNGSYTLKAWLSDLNGNSDMNTSNDMVTKTINVGPAIPNIIDNYIGVTPIKTVIASASNGVSVPRDLDFHPILSNNELWVVLKSTENSGGKTVKISNAGESNQTVQVQQDGNAWHFMSLPTALAFSDNGNFATSPGVFDANHDAGEPFTGPALWSSDPAIYAQPSGGNGSHLDMLHESPYSMGIAYEDENIFWVNDGYNNTVVRYDFGGDHGPGADDHSNGIIRQYTGLGLAEDPTRHVPSHLVLDKTTNFLYIVDSENDRVVRLDIATGNNTGNLTPHEGVTEYSSYTGYSSSTYINTGLIQPTGIDLIGNRMIVSDYNNGDIVIYDISDASGTELGRIQTGVAGIMGVKIGPDGKIWYVNATTNQVVRLDIQGLGVAESELTSAHVFPNPTNDLLNINLDNNVKVNSLKVMNTLGETVYEMNVFNSNQFQINTSNWSKGIYSIQINTETQSLIKKVVKN